MTGYAPGLPPLYDDNANIRAEDYPNETLSHFASRLAQCLAGGWDPNSVAGRQAISEFWAFKCETEAQALEALAREIDPTEKGFALMISDRIWKRAQEIRMAPVPSGVYDD